MTDIEHLHIRGFKPIEDLEVSPESINIITGRNNTGKTSFLEAIDVTANPVRIGKFDEALDTVINQSCNEARLSLEFDPSSEIQPDGTKQTRLAEPDLNERDLLIRQPTGQEAASIFHETISEVLDVNEEYPIQSGAFFDTRELGFDNEEFSDVLKKSLREAVTELPEEAYVDEAIENSLILEINGESYRYSCFKNFYSPIRNTLVKDTYNRVSDSLEAVPELRVDEESTVMEYIQSEINNRLAPRFISNQFLSSPPSDIGGVQFIDASTLESGRVDMSRENAAVKVSDIEDYLVDAGILEDLKDFSFDKLVFEDETGDKYEVPYSHMGDGFRTLVGILWELLSEQHRGNVLLLEEPGIHMHPGYMENLLGYLVRVIRRDQLQVFITTHSSDLIEGFFSDQVQAEESDFLKENFQIIQMTDSITRTLSYEMAEEELDSLNLDLRGI